MENNFNLNLIANGTSIAVAPEDVVLEGVNYHVPAFSGEITAELWLDKLSDGQLRWLTGFARDLGFNRVSPGILSILVAFAHAGKVTYYPDLRAYRQTEETSAQKKARVINELDANDKKAIRALVDGDTARILEHRSRQAALRAQLIS